MVQFESKARSRIAESIILIVCITSILFMSSCATSQRVELGTKTFNYKIPPVVKLESGKTIAVLASRTDAGQTLQAKLMEALQKTNVNIVDSQQLVAIIQERKLKLTAGELREFGKRTNVHLFLVAEMIARGRAALKAIESDGRIGFARFVEGKNEDEIVANISNLFTGYEKSFTDQPGFIFPKEDTRKGEIMAVYHNGKYQQVEEQLKAGLASSPSDLYKVTYNINLAYLYEIQEKFEEALTYVEQAEQANQRLNPFTGMIQPSFFQKQRSQLKEMTNAVRDSKAAIGSLSPAKETAPKLAILGFDTKAIQEPLLEWISAVYVSTELAQSNKYSVYDRDYFRALLETESRLSEKERGELLGVDHLVYGKFLSKTPVSRKQIFKEVTESYQDPVTKKFVCCVQKTVLDKTSVEFKLNLQGRIVDVKTAFVKLQTFDLSFNETFSANQTIPPDGQLVNNAVAKIYDDMVSWVKKTLP